MIGWETGRMDEWMMGGWKGGREQKEREEAGWWMDGRMEGWIDWESERMNTWIVLIYADDSIYLHHRLSCLAICIPPVLQCQVRSLPVARLHPYFPTQDPLRVCAPSSGGLCTPLSWCEIKQELKAHSWKVTCKTNFSTVNSILPCSFSLLKY